MAANDCVQGAMAQLIFDGRFMPFVSFQDESVREIVNLDDQAIRGDFQQFSERVDIGPKRVGFTVVLEPTPVEFDTILPRCGFTYTGTNFALSNTVGSFTVKLDRITKVHTYTLCKVKRALIQGAKGSTPVRVTLEVIGVDITEGNAGSIGSGTSYDVTYPPYAFTRGVTTLDSTERAVSQFNLMVDTGAVAQFNNSVTATTICATEIQAYFACNVPYVDTNSGLLTTPWSATAANAITGSLVFTAAAAKVLTFTFNAAHPIARFPDIPGKSEIRLPLTYALKRTTSASAITGSNITA
jgi:hypothetical protein